MIPQPFKIQASEKALADIKYRLHNTRWASEIENTDWKFGTNKKYLQSLISYWIEAYQWEKQAEALNRFPQYTCNINGVNIHYFHIKGKGPDPIPILLTHGWPDSFLRYIKTIDMLTDPTRFGAGEHDSFDVIIPSIPGFGFSSLPEHGGVNNARVADLWAQLMKQLGYNKFAAAGGDLGSGITRYLAMNHPELLIAIHLTDIGILRSLITEEDQHLSTEEKQYKQQAQQWINKEGAYISIQATKPQTLAYAFTDSPVGLAAWIIEKFYSWSGCNGDLQTVFSMDELITNIMIYWLSNSVTSSMRIYYENFNTLPPMSKISVPVGMAVFANDVLVPPKAWAEKSLPIMHWSTIPVGGHFTAMEQPAYFSEDVRKFIRQFRLQR